MLVTPVPAAGHPLVDRIWLPAEDRYIDQSTLITNLAERRFVLLGESHGHPDHHRAQANILVELALRGRQPVVAMEMMDTSQADALEQVQGRESPTAAELADAVDWEAAGWPEWKLYEPIVAAALEHELRIVAANLPLEEVRAVAREGLDYLPAEKIHDLGLDQPLAPLAEQTLRERLNRAHCGDLPDEALDRLLAAQRLRDAFMAARIAEAARPDGAILIAGSVHVDHFRGVPAYLVRAGETDSFSVAFVPVVEEETSPGDYGRDFDALWFTTPHPSPPPDPCRRD